MDVVKEAIDEGRRQFPEAHWVHYDRYNCSFNAEGTVDIPIPELGVEFDFIVAYSVFTHIAREEMHDLVGQLQARLKPSGTLAFTFNTAEFLQREFPDAKILSPVNGEMQACCLLRRAP